MILPTQIFNKKHRFLRPKVSPKQDPKAWWKFACNHILFFFQTILELNFFLVILVLALSQDRLPKLNQKFMQERRRNRVRYMYLYEAKLLNRLRGLQEQELEKMELELSPKDIV